MLLYCEYECGQDCPEDGRKPHKCGNMANFALDLEWFDDDMRFVHSTTIGYCSYHWQIMRSLYKRNKTVRFNNIAEPAHALTIRDAIGLKA